MTTELLERINQKGTWCPHRDNVLCQEGYCSECAIPNQKKIIYISGPYSRGDISRNVRDACMAANEVLEIGHIPFVPHLSHLWHIITPKPYQDWLDIDLALIPRMDGVLRLPGESPGADQEVSLANSLGIPVYYAVKEIVG